MGAKISDNSIDDGYKSKFNPLEAEKDSANGASGNNTTNPESAESKSSNNFVNSVSGKPPLSQKNLLLAMKKRGPLGAIIAIVALLGFGAAGFLTPSLLLVHVKEMILEKINYQHSSMSSATMMLYKNKFESTTSGICNNKISIACKFSTMSDKQVAKLKASGIDVESGGKTLFGRTKPSKMTFKGQEISPKDFKTTFITNTEFRQSMNSAYNTRFAGFVDNTWRKVASKLGLSKSKVEISGDTDSEKLKNVQSKTKNGLEVDADINNRKVAEGDPKPDGTKYTKAEAETFNNNLADQGSEISDTTKQIADSGKKSSSSVFKSAGSSAIKGLNVVGLAQSACGAYTLSQAVGYAAKTARLLQLTAYAMIFLNVADQIKAGDAKAEDVEYLGKVLTAEQKNFYKDVGDGASTDLKPATNSEGYRYFAYGDNPQMPDRAMQYMVAGGLTGQLLQLNTNIMSSLGSSPKDVCKLVNNPLVIAGGYIAGIAVALTGVGLGAIALNAAANAAIGVAVAYLPTLLADTIAGVLVDETTVGEEAGNALTSGSSAMMSNLAATRGNAPLTPSQAVAYMQSNTKQVALDAEVDRLSLSPFDISSKNTFMGSIAFAIAPHLYQSQSFTSSIGSIFSFVGSSFSSVISKPSFALSENHYSTCTDIDYKALGIATDIFCNPIYGIPEEAFDVDVSQIAQDMLDNTITNEKGEIIPAPLIHEDGSPVSGSAYDTFIKNCVEREHPLGYDSVENDGTTTGGECMVGNEKHNINFNIYHIAYGVQLGMDGEDASLAAAESNLEFGKQYSFYEPSYASGSLVGAGR
jgi:hypothetical protein